MLTKYYVFYLRNEHCKKIHSENFILSDPPEIQRAIESLGYGGGFNYKLYAVTDSKRYAKIFRKTRNMDYFIEREIYVEEGEKRKFDDVTDEYRIIDASFSTALWDEERDRQVVGSLYFPVPSMEHDLIEMWGYVDISEEIMETDGETDHFLSNLAFYSPDFKIFKDEYRSDLYDGGIDILLLSAFPTDSSMEFDWSDLMLLNEYHLYIHIFYRLYRDGGLHLLRDKYTHFEPSS